jgi:hypothetical protein
MIRRLAEYLEVAHTWGTTPEERKLRFPCDHVLPAHTAAYFRGITVGASPAVLFAWLCQLRAAAYSYDWISHPGRRSPRMLDPALRDVAVGQTVMDIFELVEFEPDRHLTLRLRTPGLYPPLAVSYVIVPLTAARSRLLVKLAVGFRPTARDRVARALAPWLDWWMMRRQLLNLKALAESTQRSAVPQTGGPSDVSDVSPEGRLSEPPADFITDSDDAARRLG